MPETMNAAEAVLAPALAAGRGAETALIWRGQRLSYEALAARVNRAGNALRSLGVGPGDRVLLMLKDTPDFIACYLGAIRIGAVAVALNVRLSATDLLYILRDSGARLLLIDREFLRLYEQVRDAPGQETELVVDDAQAAGESGAVTGLRGLIEPQDDALDPEPRRPDDMAFWIYTSGTTGTPKAAVHSQRDVLLAERYVGETLGVGPGDLLFATSKLFFAYSLGTCLFASLRLGAGTLLFDGWPDSATIAGLVARRRPTVVFSVPTMYRNMLAAGVATAEAFGSVRHCVSAGERLPASLWQRWREATGVEILDGMGTSETVYMLLTNAPGAIRPGASGRAAPGAEVRLADDEGAPVGPGEPGTLWARIGSCCSGYWRQPEASRQVFRDGWFRTGDMYLIDAEGYWHHQGRADDMLKISGQWVSPAEIEEVVLAETPVRDAVVVATEDSDELARTTLFAVGPEEGYDPDALEREIRAAITERLSPYKCPKWIAFIDEIPRTSTGKAQRYKLRKSERQQA